ncbi:UNVERIFIED_CONTAM: hypothetical protein H355_015865 [Colinus virginianus]|nr:hypothetical protein H355_015865 [Colinus virginianus]
MDQAAALLQPVPEVQSGFLVEEVTTDAGFPIGEAADDTSFAASSLSDTVSSRSAVAAPRSHSEDGSSISGSSEQAKKNTMAAGAGGASANARGMARCGTRGRPNTRGEKKQLYELRRLYVPAHRFTPLRKQWVMLIEPLVTHLQLQVRMNVRRRCVELRRIPSSNSSSVSTEISEESSSLLQKGSDYVRAFLLGFAVRDALALLRLDDLSIESFEVRDVKRLGGEHLSRCLARLSGRDGKTKFAIENATRTRLVIADSKIHILGSFDNIRLARHACCSLILGAPPGKVYNHLRTVTRRLAERL